MPESTLPLLSRRRPLRGLVVLAVAVATAVAVRCSGRCVFVRRALLLPALGSPSLASRPAAGRPMAAAAAAATKAYGGSIQLKGDDPADAVAGEPSGSAATWVPSWPHLAGTVVAWLPLWAQAADYTLSGSGSIDEGAIVAPFDWKYLVTRPTFLLLCFSIFISWKDRRRAGDDADQNFQWSIRFMGVLVVACVAAWLFSTAMANIPSA